MNANRLRYALLGVVAAAVVAVVVVVAVEAGSGHGSTSWSLGRGDVLAATATLSPQTLLFGQPVHVRIDAVVDRRQLDPNRVRLDEHWTPFETVANVARTRTDVGPYARLHWALDLHCVSSSCVPKPGMFVRQRLATGSIGYAGRAANGRKVAPVLLTWPEVTTMSRLDPADLQPAVIVHRPGQGAPRGAYLPWRLNTLSLSAPSYRIAPQTLFWSSSVVALLLVVAAAVILAPYLPPLRFLAPSRKLSGVERALAAVERARGGGSADERKALELLAAELRRTGSGGLARSATELAWSPPDPPADRTTALTEEVRRELAGRTNGHRD